MAIKIADKTRATVCNRLGVSALVDLMDRDFQDLTIDADVDRAQTDLYADRNRGSVRLNAGRFYTVREYAKHLRELQAIKLP